MNQTITFNTSRVETNIAAIASLFSSQPEKHLLKSYSGWGGLREAIYTPAIYSRLKKFLGDDEINSIKKTFKTGYSTPKPLVDFIYQMVMNFNCRPRRILEPSAGNGVFFEYMPKIFRNYVPITAVEIEKVNCRLLRTLYPNVEVHQKGFEHYALKRQQDKFDLIVGNPPFGQILVKDSRHRDLSRFSIHHYFVAKCMRLLKKDGILAMVLPRYFLDNAKKQVRTIIAKEGGTLLAAYRLPDDIFTDAKVCVDLVFLKKALGNDLWLTSKKIVQGKALAFINNYFVKHPENILGAIEFIEVYGRTEITCKRTLDWQSALKKISSNNGAKQLSNLINVLKKQFKPNYL